MGLVVIGCILVMSIMTVLHASGKNLNSGEGNVIKYGSLDKGDEIECNCIKADICNTNEECDNDDILECRCEDNKKCKCNDYDTLLCICLNENECEEECKGSFFPRIEYEKPDGNNGFYTKAPEVRIAHDLEDLTVYYRFVNGKNEVYAGTIDNQEYLIKASFFEEGSNILEVWVCFDAKRWYETKKFKIDRIKPRIPELLFDGIEVTGDVVSNRGIKVSAKSYDDGSGIYGFLYILGHEEVFIQGEEVEIEIDYEFVGKVQVEAVDYAGNRSSTATSPVLIIDKTPPIVQISSPVNLGEWQQGHIPINVSVYDQGISAGLKSVYCYVNDEAVVTRYFESGDDTITNTSLDFLVVKDSAAGGAVIRIDAEDISGNRFSASQQVFLDTVNPNISFQDAHNDMILGSDKTLQIIIEDNNLISCYFVDVRYTPFDRGGVSKSNEEYIITLGAGKLKNKHIVKVPIVEEGCYGINVTARDIAGRETESYINLILDKTSPIIRYVEQLNGSHIPYFQWDYSPVEMITDDTGFSYHKTLNGRFYHRSTYVDTEGIHTFQVTAVDEAGNIGVANAVFTIDNTPPEIYFYNVEEGGEYYDPIAFSIAVLGQGERIRRVLINNEEKNINRHSHLYQQNVVNYEDYKVIVEADDLAGNIATKKISFSLVENDEGKTSSLLGDVAYKMGNSIGNDMLSKVIEDTLAKVSSIWKWLIASAITLSVLGVIYIIYRKRKLKKPHKWEDARLS